VEFHKQLWAGELVFVGTIPGSGWNSTSAKNPASTDWHPSLQLLRTKEGERRLKWDLTPVDQAATLELHKAKPPANLQGNITIENGGSMIVLTASSVSLADLKTHLALPPGHYAVRRTVHRGPTIVASDWMTIRIQ
jgi:hypothetical protein